MSTPLTVTRIGHACQLIQIGGTHVRQRLARRVLPRRLPADSHQGLRVINQTELVELRS